MYDNDNEFINIGYKNDLNYFRIFFQFYNCQSIHLFLKKKKIKTWIVKTNFNILYILILYKKLTFD